LHIRKHSSAGAISSIHCAYWDDKEVPIQLSSFLGDFSSSGNGAYSNKVAGVVSWAGSIEDTAWLQNNAVPFLSIHDSLDTDMPYLSEVVCELQEELIFGDYYIHEKINEQKIYTNLFTTYEKWHVPNVDDEEYYKWLDITRDQLFALIEYQSGASSEINETEALDEDGYEISCSNHNLNIKIKGDFYIKELSFLKIYDLDGREMAHYEIKSGEAVIPIPHLGNNIYFVLFQCPELGIVHSEKVFFR
jgi:hypothetical protein